jgi:hypothetical protein
MWRSCTHNARSLSRSPSSPPSSFTQFPFPPCSLVRDGQTSPHRPRLVVSHSTRPPLSPSPHANSFVIGTAVINNNKVPTVMRELPLALPLRPWGIMACIHRCRNATRSALHESGDTPPLTTLRHLLSTPQISLCRPVVRFPPNAAFFEAVFW